MVPLALQKRLRAEGGIERVDALHALLLIWETVASVSVEENTELPKSRKLNIMLLAVLTSSF